MMNSLENIDRELLILINGSDSLFLDNLATVLTSGLTWIPLYLALFYIVIKNNETMKQILLVVGCVIICLILSDGLTDFIVKPSVQRFRPSQEPAIKYIVDTVNGIRDTKYGFFSAHAANTFGIAMFFALLIRNKLFTVVMFIWSIINCWTRIYLGLHYPFDVLVGLLWGTCAGIISYLVFIKTYFKLSPKYNYISSQFTATGYNLTDIDVVIVFLMFTLVYAILRASLFILG